MKQYMLTFPNTHSAIRAEHVLLEGGVQVGVMPMPGEVSAGCGICLRVEDGDRERAYELLRAAAVDVESWYRIEKRRNVSVYRKMEKDNDR